MKKAKASKPTDDFPYYLPNHADDVNIICDWFHTPEHAPRVTINKKELRKFTEDLLKKQKENKYGTIEPFEIKTPYDNFYNFERYEFLTRYDCGSC